MNWPRYFVSIFVLAFYWLVLDRLLPRDTYDFLGPIFLMIWFCYYAVFYSIIFSCALLGMRLVKKFPAFRIIVFMVICFAAQVWFDYFSLSSIQFASSGGKDLVYDGVLTIFGWRSILEGGVHAFVTTMLATFIMFYRANGRPFLSS